MSTNAATLEAPRNGALWVIQVFGAVLFFIAGFPKLSGDEQMIQTFAAIGIGQWLRYVTGLIDVASAILLLDPGSFWDRGPSCCSHNDPSHCDTHRRYRRKSSSADGTSNYCEYCRLGGKGNDECVSQKFHKLQVEPLTKEATTKQNVGAL
jgi:hypothetical protein